MTVRGLEGSVVGQFVYNLVPSSTFTTAGSSTSSCDAGGYASLQAIVTCSTGTGTLFRLWLQGSLDGGTNWYPLPITNVAKVCTAALGLNETNVSFTGNAVSIIAEAGPFTATTIFIAGVNAPPPLVRAAWNINGTSPSQTFAITCLLSTTQLN
jgi:hypothetical protein